MIVKWVLYRIPPENVWILDDLFRDTPLDHIWRTHILAKNTVSGCIWCVWCTIAKMWWIITLHHLKEKFENLSFLSLPVTVDPVVVTPATSSCTNQVSARAGYNLRVKGILIFDLSSNLRMWTMSLSMYSHCSRIRLDMSQPEMLETCHVITWQ